jgi:hypothetical protein
MPNGQSAYSVYRRAGRAKGEYRSSLQGLEDIATRREFQRERGAIRTERRERTLDTLMSAVELGSTLYGGYLDKQEFESSLKGVESDIFGKGTDKSAVKVGKGGKPWKETTLWEQMFSEPQYKFGEDIQMTKADVQMTSQMYKYGVDPDYSKFKPTLAAEEVAPAETATGAPKVGKGVLKPEADVGIGQDVQIAGGWGTEALGGIVPEDTGISSYDEASGTTSLEAWEKELRKKLEGVEGYN